MSMARSSTLTTAESQIVEILADIMKTKGLTECPLGADTVLDQIGLESLDFAEAVIRMEEITGKDPFATDTEFQIRTLSDLAAVYN